MGHDIKNLREVDANGVAKRLVHADAPCAAELGALMDCMKVPLSRNASGGWAVPIGRCFSHLLRMGYGALGSVGPVRAKPC